MTSGIEMHFAAFRNLPRSILMRVWAYVCMYVYTYITYMFTYI